MSQYQRPEVYIEALECFIMKTVLYDDSVHNRIYNFVASLVRKSEYDPVTDYLTCSFSKNDIEFTHLKTWKSVLRNLKLLEGADYINLRIDGDVCTVDFSPVFSH